jgi:hypothetical protein
MSRFWTNKPHTGIFVKRSVLKHARRTLFIAIALVYASVLSAQTVKYQPVNQQTEQQVAALLVGFGVTDAVVQSDRVINQSVASIAKQAKLSSLEIKQWSEFQAILADCSGSAALAALLQAQVSLEFPATAKEAEAILQNTLVSRVKNFDVSLEMNDAFDKFQSFQYKRSAEPAADERLALMRRLDNALRSSIIAALLQTEIETSAQALALRLKGVNRLLLSTALQTQEQRQNQRQQYMAGVIVDLHLFSYRFMQDAELERYVELMEQDSVQKFMDASIKGLQQSLQIGRASALELANSRL